MVATEIGDSDSLELLLETLVKIITEIPVKSLTYVLHLESVNTIITLLSGQMFWPVPAIRLAPYRVMMKGTTVISVASLLTKALIQNYIDQVEPPNPLFQRDDAGSIVIGVASKKQKKIKISWFEVYVHNCMIYICRKVEFGIC